MDAIATAMLRLRRELAEYRDRWPAERACVASFEALLDSASLDDAWRRERLDGHFTGSAFVVSADGLRTLLMHHRKLDRWLQPGGHADGDTDLGAVALREAQEETGLAGLRLEPGIFDLDRHRIPARGAEPEHWHHDVRYVLRATDEAFRISAEAKALAWRPIADLAGDDLLDPSLRRMALKWIASAGRALA